MRLARSADEKNARQSKQRKSGMARDKEEGSPAFFDAVQSDRRWTKKKLTTETCTIFLACTERQTEIAYHLCVPLSTRQRGKERGRKTRSKTGRRKGKKCEERETTACTMRGTKGKRKSERESFIVEKGFGLAFCHPLLTSVQPLLGRIS